MGGKARERKKLQDEAIGIANRAREAAALARKKAAAVAPANKAAATPEPPAPPAVTTVQPSYPNDWIHDGGQYDDDYYGDDDYDPPTSTYTTNASLWDYNGDGDN